MQHLKPGNANIWHSHDCQGEQDRSWRLPKKEQGGLESLRSQMVLKKSVKQGPPITTSSVSVLLHVSALATLLASGL